MDQSFFFSFYKPAASLQLLTMITAWAVQVEGQTEYLNCRTVNPRRIEVRGAYGLVVEIHEMIQTF